MTAYTGQNLLDALDSQGLSDWQGRSDSIGTRLLTGGFATGLYLVNKIGAAAERAGHHPAITLTFPHVDIQLTSHEWVSGRAVAGSGLAPRALSVGLWHNVGDEGALCRLRDGDRSAFVLRMSRCDLANHKGPPPGAVVAGCGSLLGGDRSPDRDE